VVSVVATRLDNVDSMHVPGATTSGLNRCSLVGPRLLNAAMPSGSLAWWSEFSGLVGKSLGQYVPYVGSKFGRSLSVAPTVTQFLADGSWEIEPWSTTPLALASVPSLPAAYRITMSGWFHTKSSISCDDAAYPVTGVPQELVCTRTPSLSYTGWNRSCRSTGMPPRFPPLSKRDCRTSWASGAVPWIFPPMLGAVPSPSTDPQTCVPWPSGSSDLAGLARPSAYSFLTRPEKAGCTLLVEPRSNPVSATPTS